MYNESNTDLFRQIFQLHPRWHCDAEQFVKKITHEKNPGAKKFVSVHVRRADSIYFFKKQGVVPYPLENGTFLNQLIDDYAKNCYRCLFLVFSDDVEWCKANIKERPDLEIVSTQSQFLDFSIMSLLNSSIVTQGGNGLLAGILSGGDILRLVPNPKNYKHFKHLPEVNNRPLGYSYDINQIL
jgi:hypothetical protein